jgi:hypothetical protein
MTISGNTEAFILAIIAFVGLFAYVLILAVLGRDPDPTIFPALIGIATGAGSFFFSGHIANGAAGKALDALVQTGKDRETAIIAASDPTAVAAAASAATNGRSDIPQPPRP